MCVIANTEMVDDITAADLDTTPLRKRKRTQTQAKSSSNIIDSSTKVDNKCDAETMVAQRSRKLKQYVLEEKLDIIDYAKVIGNRAAGREFNVAESSIREWRKNEQRLRSMFETTPERSRLDGGGRRPVSEDLEKGLLQYVASKNDSNTSLTWHDIKEKANSLWKEICDQNPGCTDRGFTANMGWVARFVRRNNITMQVTNSASIRTGSSNSGGISSNSTTTINDSVNRISMDSICCSPSRKKVTNATSTTSATVSAFISDHSVMDSNVCLNDIREIVPATKLSTTVTSLTTTTTTVTCAAITSTTTTITVSNLASAKKRRKNFIPKKVVPNDVICLATNNKKYAEDSSLPLINSVKTTQEH
ncbi:unnamed protein product [Thelazia callipaeda]|uniref:HTH CENPB-type domain-containing protein n=1 Tax=Thelazia callipaeda TaxID=103827 RepID=A0A0N5D8Y4_THECL|nr:unnamed protein product [Thelazia callipaeda]